MKPSKPKPVLKAHQQKTTPKSRTTTRSSLSYYARDADKTKDLKTEIEDTLTQNLTDKNNDHPTQTDSSDSPTQSQIEAFTQDQDSLTQSQATDWLEHHFQNEGTTVKLTLSPGTDLGSEDLKQLTRDVISELETLKGESIDSLSYIHQDTTNPHTHTLLNLDSPLSEKDIDTLRNVAGLLLGSLLKHHDTIGLEQADDEMEDHIQITSDHLVAHQRSDQDLNKINYETFLHEPRNQDFEI